VSDHTSQHIRRILTLLRHITTNPTSYIVTISEHAAKKILALKAPSKPSTAGPVRA
jgi:hypothetical protein